MTDSTIQTLSLSTDEQAIVAITFPDAIGGAASAPTTRGTISIQDATVLGATLSDDGSAVLLVPVTAGSTTLTYTDGTLSAALSVTITAPVAVAANFDIATAILSAKSSAVSGFSGASITAASGPVTSAAS